MKYEAAKNYLESCQSVDFLDALYQLSESFGEIVDGVNATMEDAFDIVLAYFDRRRNIELFSPETDRQIAYLQAKWGEDDVLWRCVERAYHTAVSEEE